MILEILLGIGPAVLLGLSVWLLAEVSAALIAPTRRRAPDAEPGRVAVVVPAHDEASVIGATVAGLRAQLRPEDRLLVVADNCTDETAHRAREEGATVAERWDPERRGKGYALQHAIDSLRADPPAVIVFVDADCAVGPGLVRRLAGAAAASARPAQSLDLMIAPKSAGPASRVAEFAWLFINRTRMTGLYALTGTCRMLGTGMAMPWALLEGRSLASSEIVEDLALAIETAGEGRGPVFVPDVVVTSEFPTSEAARAVQRARWEHGSLGLARRAALPLFLRSLTRGRWAAAALALDVMIPPLTVMAALLLISLVLSAAFVPFGIVWPVALSAAACVAFALSVGLGWWAHGRGALPPAALANLGAYAASKLRVYGGAGRASSREWRRTERE